MHNLLNDRLIRVRLSGGNVDQLSLPEVYEVLLADQVDAFLGLRPHQRHAWHAFLAQLAVITLHQNARHEPYPTAQEWREALRGITKEYDGDAPWELVLDDPTRPAFMQPPSLNGLKDYKKDVYSPDDLDILVTAKNHELKQNTAISHSLDDWVYSLISLQTMAPFSGRGNYGIARMNGGNSSRPCLGLGPRKGGLGAYLFHDIRHMISGRGQVLEDYQGYYQEERGVSLLWTKSWDGSGQLTLDELDPYFIEVCRRVRLYRKSGSIMAKRANSSKSRIAAKAAKGNLGDHWTPVDVKRGCSLSLSKTRLHYEKLTELLIGSTFRLPAAMKVKDSNKGLWKVIVRGLAGGQGKTEGYHERADLAFSDKTARALIFSSPQDELIVLVKEQLDEVSGIANALKRGIAVAASGKREVEKQDWERAKPYMLTFHKEIDLIFFSFLDKRFVADTDENKKEIRLDFGRNLVRIAREVFNSATQRISCPLSSRYRAQALAEIIFNGQLRMSVFSDQPEVFSTENNLTQVS